MATRALLHILQLPIDQYNYERNGMQWILQVDTNKENRFNEGDVVYFPELLSGAGEFEV